MKAYNAQYKYNQQVCCRQEGKKTRNQKYVGIPSQQIQCKKRIAVHQDIKKIHTALTTPTSKVARIMQAYNAKYKYIQQVCSDVNTKDAH